MSQISQTEDLTDRAVGNLYEVKVIVDKTYGHAAYGCATCCGFGDSPSMVYDPLGVDLDATSTQGVSDIDFCTGGTVSVTEFFPDANWDTADHAVATASGPVVTGVAVGTTGLTTTGTITIGNANAFRCPQVQASPSGPANVTPTITSISPAQGLVGVGTGVTITGKGFASGATINAGSNISVSSVSVSSSTQMTATFTPKNSSSAGGNQGVTVSVPGSQPSNSVNFYDQVPTDSMITSTLLNYAMNTTSNPACPSGQAGWYRKVQKITTDQNTPAGNITANGATISETLGLTGTNQLNLSAPTPFAPVQTSGGGYLDDQFGFCSPLCPGSSGQTDLTEVFTDQPASGGASYTLKAHTLAYTCTGDTDNGQ